MNVRQKKKTNHFRFDEVERNVIQSLEVLPHATGNDLEPCTGKP
jgi:hypothetical protein